jgi:regulator of replication initiation timing
MITSLFTAYLRQQKQLGVDDYILDRDLVDLLSLKQKNISKQKADFSIIKTNQQNTAMAIKEAIQKTVSQKKAESSSVHARLSSLRPVNAVIPLNPVEKSATEQSVLKPSKREELKQLYTKSCNACHLAYSRKRWVLGLEMQKLW